MVVNLCSGFVFEQQHKKNVLVFDYFTEFTLC